MQKRPIGVSVISWLVIIYWAISLLLVILMVVNSQRMVEVRQHLLGFSPGMMKYIMIMAFINPVINIIVASLMLRGVDWSRHVFLAFNAVVLIISLIIAPQKMALVVTVIVFLIFLYFLYNRSANMFFRGKSETAHFRDDTQ